MNFKKKLGLALITAVACIIAFNSCKKDDKKQDAQNDELARIREKVNSQPFSNTNVVNLKGKGYYGDADGNRIIETSGNKNVNGISTLSGGCPDPGNDEPEQAVYSVKSELVCGQGYTVEVTYKVTLVYNPLFQNATGALSFGKVRFKNAAGTVIWPTTSSPKYNIVSITPLGDNGTDSYGLTYTVYHVTFKTDYIPENIMTSAASMETYLSVYTDCPNYPTFVCPYSAQQATTSFLTTTLPCNRTDRIYYDGAHLGDPPYIVGAAVRTSCIPSGYVFPTYQEVQFKNTNGVWGPFVTFGVSDANHIARKYIKPYDIFKISVSETPNLVPGYVQVRYRNSMGDSGCWSDWVYDNWYVNYN